jgi:hypothetical protein
MKNIEFFHDPSNLTREQVLFKRNGEYMTFSELEDNTIAIIMTRLVDCKKSLAVLRRMRMDGITDPRSQVEQFAKCNWGNLDDIPDIENTGFNFEYVKCGHKGSKPCPHNHSYCIVKTKTDEKFNKKYTA